MSKAAFVKPVVYLVLILLLLVPAAAQKKSKKAPPRGKAVMWEPVNIRQRDLFYGPGGKNMLPNLSRITYLKEEKSGHNKKYRIRDGAGRVWVAKLGREAQPETAAVRLLWALGYKTEINYLVPSLTIPGKGTFRNVRLEARHENIDRVGQWKWKRNPFLGTNELQGLKIMMVLFKNWDIVDVQNEILEVKSRSSKEHHYIISDLGATFGRLGNNNFPIIYRLGRSVGKPRHFVKSQLIREVENDRVVLSYKGKNRDIFKNITVRQAAWLYGLLAQVSDKQITDAFRAANYPEADIALYLRGVKDKIDELAQVAGGERLAAK